MNALLKLPVGALVIDEAAFELFKARFEPLGPAEEHVRIRTDGDSQGPASEV